MNRRHLYAALCFLLCACTAAAQNKHVNTTSQLWSEIDFAGKLPNRFKWQCDFQYSRQSPYEKVSLVQYNEQLTIRPWLHYYFKPSLKLSAFTGLWYNYFIGGNVQQRQYPEYRTALQIQLYRNIKRNSLSVRLRTELREIKNRQQHFETVFRERTMFKFQRLLTHSAYDKNSLYFIAQDELFLNDGSAVTGYNFFDQNRIFVGLGYNISNNIAVETGYFNQFVHHAHDPNFDANNIVQASLIVDNLTGPK